MSLTQTTVDKMYQRKWYIFLDSSNHGQQEVKWKVFLNGLSWRKCSALPAWHVTKGVFIKPKCESESGGSQLDEKRRRKHGCSNFFASWSSHLNGTGHDTYRVTTKLLLMQKNGKRCEDPKNMSIWYSESLKRFVIILNEISIRLGQSNVSQDFPFSYSAYFAQQSITVRVSTKRMAKSLIYFDRMKEVLQSRADYFWASIEPIVF